MEKSAALTCICSARFAIIGLGLLPESVHIKHGYDRNKTMKIKRNVLMKEYGSITTAGKW